MHQEVGDPPIPTNRSRCSKQQNAIHPECWSKFGDPKYQCHLWLVQQQLTVRGLMIMSPDVKVVVPPPVQPTRTEGQVVHCVVARGIVTRSAPILAAANLDSTVRRLGRSLSIMFLIPTSSRCEFSTSKTQLTCHPLSWPESGKPMMTELPEECGMRAPLF